MTDFCRSGLNKSSLVRICRLKNSSQGDAFVVACGVVRYVIRKDIRLKCKSALFTLLRACFNDPTNHSTAPLVEG